MATKIQYLTYYVHLTDAAEVAALQAQYPTGRNLAVVGNATGQDAVTIYNAPYRGYIQPAAALAPFTWTPWKRGALPGVFPLNVRTFSRTTGGFWGFFSTTTTYYWMAKFMLAGTPIPIIDGEEVEQVAMARRRWVMGFTGVPWHEDGAGGASPEVNQADTNFAILRTSRSFGRGRVLGDLGWTQDSAITVIGQKSTTSEIGGGVSAFTESWERIYIKPRVTDITTVAIWKSTENGGNQLIVLGLTAGGTIIVYNGNGGVAAGGLVGATSVACNMSAWNKIDILMQCNTGSGFGRIRVYIKGVLGCDISIPAASSGLGGAGRFHSSSALGNSTSTNGAWQIDYGAWINAEMPTANTDGDFTGADWIFGSRIIPLKPRAFAGSHSVNWSGDIRLLKQHVMAMAGGVAPGLTCSTALAQARVTTDLDEALNQVPQALGIAAMTVGVSSRAGAAGPDGRVGWNINGTGDTLTTVVENVAAKWRGVLYRPTGLLVPEPVTSLELIYEKANDATAARLDAIVAHVEAIGIFGDEDIAGNITSGTDPSNGVTTGEHNAPYARSPWALPTVSAPIAPYVIYSGTYVGNGTGTTLQFKSPIHMLWVRPLTGGTGGGSWWSTMLAAKDGDQQGLTPAVCLDAREDQTFVPGLSEDEQQQRYQIDITGNGNNTNALGVTYNYVAVSDPGMRFMCNGSFHHPFNLATTMTNALPNANFTPEWMWLNKEEVDTSTADARYIKSPALAAASLVPTAGGAVLANAITFAAGALISQQAAHFAGLANLAVSCWRRADGNADVGQQDVVAFGTYTGDGSSPRIITPSPASTKRPLWVWVQPEAASGVYRDASHTGTISTNAQSGGDIAANGISAGAAGSFTVGSQLNTNLTVYHYFVLWGSTTAGNNGWSPNGEFVPVEPNSPADGPWPDDPPVPVDPDILPIAGEPDLDATDVLADSDTSVGGTVGGDFCESYTRELVNIALGHIGISKPIANLNTELSEAAAVARTHIRSDVNRTLRDFPWDFATRYENLVLHSGTSTVPVNNDWQFAYVAPNAMMLARRIAKIEKGRRFDQDPIPFREGLIDEVPVIYCNAEASDDVPLVLEFTVRVECPAFFGDALFREALTWKFAASFAQSLSRDSEKQKFALQMYDATLHRATSVDAKEQQQEKPGDADWILGRN